MLKRGDLVKHYRGKLYRILGLAKNVSTGEELVIFAEDPCPDHLKVAYIYETLMVCTACRSSEHPGFKQYLVEPLERFFDAITTSFGTFNRYDPVISE